MQIEKINYNNIEMAHVIEKNCIITNLDSAIDLIMTVYSKTGIKNIILSKSLITNDFFILSTGLAGEILQKFINYNFRIAIYGDYSKYTSQPLKAFIYESNKGDNIFFVDTLKNAIEKLAK